MNVYLVPLGPRRYELYCEVGEHDGPVAVSEHSGWVARLEDKFRTVMQAIERHSREPSHSLWSRVRNRVLGWLAERVAEQRLLWHIRLHRDVTLHFPRDMGADEAQNVMRQSFRADVRRHWVWLAVNVVLLALAGLLTVIPGPNVVAFYFAFRVVGHYMSVRGAKHGLADVAWTMTESDDLMELRQAIGRPPAERVRHVSAIAERLDLEKLVAFVERMTLRAA